VKRNFVLEGSHGKYYYSDKSGEEKRSVFSLSVVSVVVVMVMRTMIVTLKEKTLLFSSPDLSE
jgi:hypothetical protein